MERKVNKKVAERTAKILARFDGLPGEFYMLKGLLCMGFDDEVLNKAVDTRAIAIRMDAINGAG